MTTGRKGFHSDRRTWIKDLRGERLHTVDMHAHMITPLVEKLVAGRPEKQAELQARTRGDDFSVAIGQPLADRNRGGAMIDPDDEELLFHRVRDCARPGVSRNSPRACPERAGSRLRTNLTTR